MSIVSAAMRDAVGRELERRVSHPVSESDIRRWALAVYHPEAPPREYLDAAYAASTQHRGIVAPAEFNPFAWSIAEGGASTVGLASDDPDLMELAVGVPAPGLRFQLNGGVDVDYGAPIRPGDVITSVCRLVGYRERQRRLGAMLLTFTEDTWTNQRGGLVKRGRTTLIRY